MYHSSIFGPVSEMILWVFQVFWLPAERQLLCGYFLLVRVVPVYTRILDVDDILHTFLYSILLSNFILTIFYFEDSVSTKNFLNIQFYFYFHFKF